MATLTSKQLKDSYQGLLTIKTADDANPLSGRLENGLGNAITALGIGTDSPSTELEVGGSSNTQVLISSTTNTGNSQLYFGDSDSDTAGVILYRHNGDSMAFEVNDAEAMRIDSSGNVGIGTDTPDTLLEISAADPILTIRDTSTGLSDANATLRLAESGGSGTLGDYWDVKMAPEAIAGSTNFVIANGGSERMRIDSSGGVIFKGSLASHQTNAGAIEYFSNQMSLKSYGATSGTGFFTVHTGGGGGVAGSEAMRIDSSGNVGIGDTNPVNGYLTIRGATTTGTKNGHIMLTGDSATNGQGPQIVFSESGVTSNFAGASVGYVRTGSNGIGDLVFGTRATSGDADTVPTERMRIDSSGRLLSGTETALDGFSGTAQRACFSATGDTMTVEVGTGTGAYTGIHVLRQNSNGKVLSFERNSTDVGSISVTTTATAYNTSSDYRLKENVVELTGALDRVDQLKPSRFNFIADADTTVDGFLAHEVADIVPEAISGEKDAVDDEGNPIYQGIDQSKLVPLLVGAIQELKAEIEQLKAQS